MKYVNSILELIYLQQNNFQFKFNFERVDYILSCKGFDSCKMTQRFVQLDP